MLNWLKQRRPPTRRAKSAAMIAPGPLGSRKEGALRC